MASQLAAKAAMKHKVGKLGDAFGQKSTGKKDQKDNLVETFEDPNAGSFESAPANFPPYLNLCYIDRQILSSRAKALVDKAHGLFVLTNVASFLNLIGNLAQKAWVWAGVSGASFVVMFLAELCLYEYTFRACYKTSRLMQKLYLPIGTLNALVFGAFAFVNVGWLNGWTVLADDLSMPLLMLHGVESIAWTVLMCLQVHATFSMYGVRSSHTLGLAPNVSPPLTSPAAQAAHRDPRQARVDEIRSRYAKDDGVVLPEV